MASTKSSQLRMLIIVSLSFSRNLKGSPKSAIPVSVRSRATEKSSAITVCPVLEPSAMVTFPVPSVVVEVISKAPPSSTEASEPLVAAFIASATS